MVIFVLEVKLMGLQVSVLVLSKSEIVKVSLFFQTLKMWCQIHKGTFTVMRQHTTDFNYNRLKLYDNNFKLIGKQ